MTDRLPPQLLALFAARPALKYIPPSDHALEERRTAKIDGIAKYLPKLKEEFGNYIPTESPIARKDRLRYEKEERQQKLINEDFKQLYKPKEDKNIRGNGFETLFLSRLSYNTTVDDLTHHFRRYGRIERVRIVVGSGIDDKKHAGKPRGYAFIQFEREDDMKAAYKASEHLVLNGRPVIVDVERGRTVNGWRPRRFGGGLGGRHYTRAPKPQPNRFTGPPAGPGFRGGGFRGRGGRGFSDRGGYSGGRGFGAPSGAPAGPRSGGYSGGGGGGGSGGGYGGRGSGGGYGDRDRGGRNANYEPVQPRGEYRDRDSYGGGGSGGGGGRRHESSYDDRPRGPRY